MASTHVLRVRRTDDNPAHLLLNVTQTSKTRPLDLKLVATDHEQLYHGTIKANNLEALKAEKYKGDRDEWKAIIAYALLHKPSEANLKALDGLELVAKIEDDETCTLSLRTYYDGVLFHFGDIKLKHDDTREEVSAFEWVDTAVAASDGLRTELADIQASLGAQQAQVAKLTSELDNLVKAKKEHEEQLLRKFAALLDTKKAKIREQQREINATNKDQSHRAGASSHGKRKANTHTPEEEENAADDNADDDEFDEEDEEGQRTPDQETEDEVSDGGFAPPQKPSSTKAATSSSAVNQKRAEKAASESRGNDESAMEVDLDDMPPRRELPFARRAPRDDENGAPREKAPAPLPVEDEDDTDDEL